MAVTCRCNKYSPYRPIDRKYHRLFREGLEAAHVSAYFYIQTLRDTVVHTFNFDKKRRNSGSSDLLLVSVLSFLLHNLESIVSFAILFLKLFLLG